MIGKGNFRNMSRYSDICEKTYSRWYRKSFDFKAFNEELIFGEFPKDEECIAAIDASFISKSGKCTAGLGMFWNGSTGSAKKGLEVSLISIIHFKSNTAYALDARQTIDQKDQEGPSRTDLYAKQTTDIADILIKHGIKYLATDSFYSKTRFVDPVTNSGIDLVGKLRIDANLKWIYRGPYSGCGRPRKFNGKINIDSDIDLFDFTGEIDDGATRIYTAIVHSVNLKRKIKVVLLQSQDDKGEFTGSALLFSTDLKIDTKTLVKYYRARYQIEFVFRDAKNHTGLMDCQSTKKESIKTHLNASFTALNLMKIEDRKSKNTQSETVISIASWKRRKFNEHLMQKVFSKLEISLTDEKVKRAYDEMRNYGVIAA